MLAVAKVPGAILDRLAAQGTRVQLVVAAVVVAAVVLGVAVLVVGRLLLLIVVGRGFYAFGLALGGA